MTDSARLDPNDVAAWRTWFREIGSLCRRMRELLGLSQEQLGRLVKVSQGAVSRFEKGTGLNTPWIVAVKIRVALAARLRQLDPQLLTDDARRFLAQTDLYGLPVVLSQPPGIADVALAPVADFETALRIYGRLPDEARQAFLAVMNAVAGALAGRQLPPRDAHSKRSQRRPG